MHVLGNRYVSVIGFFRQNHNLVGWVQGAPSFDVCFCLFRHAFIRVQVVRLLPIRPYDARGSIVCRSECNIESEKNRDGQPDNKLHPCL